MLIEKSKNTEETVEILEKVIERTKEEDKDVLIRIIKIVFKEKLGDDEVERLVNKIEEGREKEVLAVIDMIRRENQMYIDIGRKEGRKEDEEGREEEREGRSKQERNEENKRNYLYMENNIV